MQLYTIHTVCVCVHNREDRRQHRQQRAAVYALLGYNTANKLFFLSLFCYKCYFSHLLHHLFAKNC